jgi:energy-coupling factor transporter ATP-binding protein EcfA2
MPRYCAGSCSSDAVERIEIPEEMRARLSDPRSLPTSITLNSRSYVPQSVLGSGFKSVVWLATDDRGRERALKLALYEDYRSRSYQGELSRAARLERYPAFARLEDAGRTVLELADGGEFDCVVFVEEYVAGIALDQFLKTRQQEVTPSFFLAYVRGIFGALAALEAQGLAHDDLHMAYVIVAESPEGSLDKECTFKVIDLGSVKPSEAVTKPLHDFDRVVEHLVEIYNRIVQRRVGTRRDRRLLSECVELFRRMTESDAGVALRKPVDVVAAFESADSRSAARTGLGGQAMTSPFEFVSAENISDDQVFIELFAETPWLSRVASRDAYLITGPRGCGKSTLMRWLALKTQLLRPTPDLDGFGIAGFFISCSASLEGRFGWMRDEHVVERHQDDLVHYFNLVLATEVIDTLIAMQEHPAANAAWAITGDTERLVLDFLQEALGAYSAPLRGASRLRQALELVERERVTCDLRMRRGGSGGARTVPAFISDFAAFLVDVIPYFKNHRITFLVDDFTARRVHPPVQKVLNQVIWGQRSQHHLFKVTSEKNGTILTDVNGQPYELTRELTPVDIGREYLSLAEGPSLTVARAFATKLLDNRLDIAKYTSDARTLLGDSVLEAGTLDRALRFSGGRSQYHGLKTIADLCSGDISTLLGVYRAIFDGGHVARTTSQMVKPSVQHDAIVRASTEQVNVIKRHVPQGREMRLVVQEFGTLVGNVLRDGKLIRQSGGRIEPPAIPRIEVDDEGHAEEVLEGELAELYEELVRRGIFIEMEAGRSRRGHVPTLRWQLRRVYLPSFGAALKKNVALKLSPAEFKWFLESPQEACDDFYKRQPKEAPQPKEPTEPKAPVIDHPTLPFGEL